MLRAVAAAGAAAAAAAGVAPPEGEATAADSLYGPPGRVQPPYQSGKPWAKDTPVPWKQQAELQQDMNWHDPKYKTDAWQHPRNGVVHGKDYGWHNGKDSRHSWGWWMGQVMDPGGVGPEKTPGKYWCDTFDGMSPTCTQCIRGSGGLSALPPSTWCGQCVRRPDAANCGKCWDSLPQIFDGVADGGQDTKQTLTVKTKCQIPGGNWDDQTEHYCEGGTAIPVFGRVTSHKFHTVVMVLAPVCEHLCRRMAFKFGSPSVCCTIRDGEDYPNAHDHKKYRNKDSNCTAIAGMEKYGFKEGMAYPCEDMNEKNSFIRTGCWATASGHTTARERPVTHTDQTRLPDGSLQNPGLGRSMQCEGFGAQYDTSGDIISVQHGAPADRAGVRTGMRIVQIETGDPMSPLVPLQQDRSWIDVTQPELVKVNVTKDASGGIGATFHTNRLHTVNAEGVLNQALQRGYPHDWPGNTGTSGQTNLTNDDVIKTSGAAAQYTGAGNHWVGNSTIWNCKAPNSPCLPAYRRGATPGMIVRNVNGVNITSHWDILRELDRAPSDAQFFVTIQVDVQAVIDRNFALCSPDNLLAARHSLTAGDYDQPDNVGVRIEVQTGPMTLPFQGVDPNGKLGNPFGQSGVPCDACINQLPSPDAFVGCLQNMCDWSARLRGYSTQTPLKVIEQVHSWQECQHQCCINDDCAAIVWYSSDSLDDVRRLECDLLPAPYKETFVPIDGSKPAAPHDRDCLKGCVSDRVCEWTSKYEGDSPAKIIKTVSNINSMEQCTRECCKHGQECKSVAWHSVSSPNLHMWKTVKQPAYNAFDCDLLAEFYDTPAHKPDFFRESHGSKIRESHGPRTTMVRESHGGTFVQNKWNGALNPTCKYCIDSMPDLDSDCNACQKHGLKADCELCWKKFTGLGPDCHRCWESMVPEFWTGPVTASPTPLPTPAPTPLPTPAPTPAPTPGPTPAPYGWACEWTQMPEYWQTLHKCLERSGTYYCQSKHDLPENRTAGLGQAWAEGGAWRAAPPAGRGDARAAATAGPDPPSAAAEARHPAVVAAAALAVFAAGVAAGVAVAGRLSARRAPQPLLEDTTYGTY